MTYHHVQHTLVTLSVCRKTKHLPDTDILVQLLKGTFCGDRDRLDQSIKICTKVHFDMLINIRRGAQKFGAAKISYALIK